MEIKLNQSPVVFNDADHTYFLNGKQLNGVTSTLIKRAYPNTYPVPPYMTAEQWQAILDNAAKKGTAIHQTIELYEEMGVTNDSPELKNYISVKTEGCYENIATEYIVSDEKDYASAIDHVWARDMTIVLVDIKRTSEIHWDEVTLQLSIYKKFFREQNPHLKDYKVEIAVLWLRDAKYDFRLLNPLPESVIDSLIEADLKGEPYEIQKYYGDLSAQVANAQKMLIYLNAELSEKKALYERVTGTLLNMMQERGIQSYKGDLLTLTVSQPSNRESFDTKKFKEDHPDLYKKYKTTTKVKSSLRITFKK